MICGFWFFCVTRLINVPLCMSLLKHRLVALSSEVFSLGGVAVGNRLAEEAEGWSEAKAWISVTQSMRLLAGAKRRVLTIRIRSQQRNDTPGRVAGIGVYRACRFGAKCLPECVKTSLMDVLRSDQGGG